jgi:hypothetical protein
MRRECAGKGKLRPRVVRLTEIFKALGAAPGDRVAMAALAALIALAPLVFVFAHRGVAPLALALGAVVAARAPVWRAGVPRFLTRPDPGDPLARAGLAFLAFCLWASATAFWSPSPYAWRLSLGVLAPALAAGALVFEISRRPASEARLLAAVAEATIFAAVALLLFEALTGGFLRSVTPPADASGDRRIDMVALGRGMTALTTAFFGGVYLAVARGRSRWLLAALFAAAYVAAARFTIFANEFALAAGAATGLAALRAPRATVVALAGAGLVLLAAAPLAARLPVNDIFAALPEGAPVSWLQRLAIWKSAGAAAIDCLPWGCGAEYARSWSAAGATAPAAGVELPLLPIHPHDAFIEVWLELGVPGAALLALAIAFGAQALLAAKLDRGALAATAACAAAFLVECLVELSIWQVWRLSALALAATLIALGAKTREKPAPGAAVPGPAASRPDSESGRWS